VKHRVRLNEDKERISMGYFVFPKEDSVIRSSKYKPFTHGDFRAQVQQDLKTLGFKVGLEKFKLTHASSS
jgi:isopenicillin N synthase-like dioxygenase